MNLPITQIYGQLDKILAKQGQCVIIAPPGAGKSTLLPLHLLEQVKGMILLVEPRRIAARSVARRMAELLGEEVGKTVGYAMRMEHKQSKKTRILVVTEGVFSHRLLDNPTLDNVDVVLFDEFHERSLDGDFGLALALDVREALRPDLKLIVMSATLERLPKSGNRFLDKKRGKNEKSEPLTASIKIENTLDGARVAKLMGDAPTIQALGQQFEVDIRYQPPSPQDRLEQAMARVIVQTLAQENGNILAFLPGRQEIERTVTLLENSLPPHILIAPLYGALSVQAQDAAIRQPESGIRKVVLATSIAQTSLTIEGVRIVIDSGLARLPIYEPERGLTRLETVRASQADIEQRAGRAGRLEPGIAIRLWHEGQTRARPEFSPPEILSADLSALLLDCAAFGVHDPGMLAFLDLPPKANCALAQQLLIKLGALDIDGRLTPTGSIMRKLGLPLRYAHMVACVPCQKSAQLALLMSERGLGGNDIDIENRFQRFCRDKSAKAQKIRQLATKIITKIPAKNSMMEDSIAALLLYAWPDRVARARGQYGHFLLANGRAAQIDPAHKLAKARWLIVADVTGQARCGTIVAAIEIDEETVKERLKKQIETVTITEFDSKTATIRAIQKTKLGALDLSNSPLPPPSGERANQAWARAIRQHTTAILPWNKNSLGLRQRLQWLHGTLSDPWPDITEALLQEKIRDFLPGLADLKESDNFLESALLALIPYHLQRQIDTLAPKYFTAPTGTKIALDYGADTPIVRIKVQELFGLNHHPTIANGKVKLIFELLSPASRSLQITQNLTAFWRGSWNMVRAEMQGRYPKHVWPQDPTTASPIRYAKPRRA